ncbi:MAG: hypothetical protein H6709_09455 [Kofleriaceae bacterium]|nr:hypothetical protein [Myxococcales bacterium]MCB9561579.1 hypothetical protein [Kofleriaceae bacterium]MCB9572297.1 hypothetical protein [Kofleriaceae bacterium]
MKALAIAVVVPLAACGSSKPPTGATGAPPSKMDQMMDEGMHESSDASSTFGPLEVGADWQTYTRVDDQPFPSPTHGGRMVEVWVNDVGVAAYESEDAEIPVGTIVVKTSHEKDGSMGPIFVMEKKAKGFDAEHDDWWYAIHWAEPSGAWTAKGGGPIYWRTPSHKVDYCWDCHESFDRELGGVPVERRAW